MWQKFVAWVKALFGIKQEVALPTFSGWIKDTPDSRDQVYGETK